MCRHLLFFFLSGVLLNEIRADFVVRVADGLSATADAVAESRGLTNLGRVFPDDKLFHLGASGEHHRVRRDLHEELLGHLGEDDQVESVEQHSQELIRVKRVPLQRRQACFISTVGRDARRCIFPFVYKNKAYFECTARDSTNGAEWCATQVRANGEVIPGQWGDCDPQSVRCVPDGPPLPRQQQRPALPGRRPGPAGLPPRPGGPARLPPGFPPLPPHLRPNGFGAAAGRNTFELPHPLNLVRGNGQPSVGLVEQPAAPDVDPRELRTQFNDDMWPNMWFLNRDVHFDPQASEEAGLDMNVEDAWKQGYSGKGVVVTILDDGVEHTHPDLSANYDPEASIDLNDNDGDPFPRYDFINSNKHGTRCAGTVAAAANNSECVVGIAFGSKVGGVRVLDGPILDVLEAKALSFNRDHIDIYSASWGPDDNGKTVDGPGELARRAIRDGVEKGRNGKGSIFVWASGNGGKNFDSCNADGYTTSIYTLSVSSASENGLIPWYSEQCSSSIATTYSSGSKRFRERKVVTTDLHGRCTDQHTGTSASSPMAAAMVALVLEANPDLTWRDVQHIVVRTARPRGNLKAEDWSVNGVGLGFSHAFGFGLMDGGAMTRLAKQWQLVPPQTSCTTADALTSPVVIPGGGQSHEVQVDLSNTDCDIEHLEHVHFHVNLKTKAKRGDLSITITSPAGTTSTILANRPSDDIRTGLDLYEKWPMMSVHFWGEPIVASDQRGVWIVTLYNRGDRPATLNNFKITFYGTVDDPQPDMPIRKDDNNDNEELDSNEDAVDHETMDNDDHVEEEVEHVDQPVVVDNEQKDVVVDDLDEVDNVDVDHDDDEQDDEQGTDVEEIVEEDAGMEEKATKATTSTTTTTTTTSTTTSTMTTSTTTTTTSTTTTTTSTTTSTTTASTTTSTTTTTTTTTEEASVSSSTAESEVDE